VTYRSTFIEHCSNFNCELGVVHKVHTVLECSICGSVLKLSNEEIVIVRNHLVADGILFQVSLFTVLMVNTCCGASIHHQL
jgi:hypothetical protein